MGQIRSKRLSSRLGVNVFKILQNPYDDLSEKRMEVELNKSVHWNIASGNAQ